MDFVGPGMRYTHSQLTWGVRQKIVSMVAKWMYISDKNTINMPSNRSSPIVTRTLWIIDSNNKCIMLLYATWTTVKRLCSQIFFLCYVVFVRKLITRIKKWFIPHNVLLEMNAWVHFVILQNYFCSPPGLKTQNITPLIWRHWTYKMPVRYILSSVWVRSGIFSQLSNIM